MENISCFRLRSTFEAASEGGTLAYPNTSYIEDTAKLCLLSSPKQYMYVEALEDGLSVQFNQLLSASANSLEYSTDQTVWKTITNGVSTDTINAGEKLYFRGDVTNMSTTFDIDNGIAGIGTFAFDKKCNVGGNIMSLLFNDNFEDKYDLGEYYGIFTGLFGDINKTGMLIHADKLTLSAKILSLFCYISMFTGCTSLTTAPLLPATTLAAFCYAQMFKDCTSLVNAPKLSATTLADSCYCDMFNGCTSLTIAPELPATILAEYCYNGMFEDCTSLTTAPELPATTLAEHCYFNMFHNCTSLVNGPRALPATTLADYCYESMFDGCTSLVNVPSILPSTTLVFRCYWFMFYGCSSLTTAPVLPAATLVKCCYYKMFYKCTSLSNITMLATDISATSCLYGWASDVASTGTFTKHPSMTSLSINEHGIPKGWTVVDYAA